MPAPTSGPDHFLTALRNADWSAFDASRDLLPLRTALAGLEQRYGVTDAHRFATEQIRSAGPDGAVLRHPDGHLVEIDALALSPCTRYLAGSHVRSTPTAWGCGTRSAPTATSRSPTPT
jgi:hypothetical protein